MIKILLTIFLISCSIAAGAQTDQSKTDSTDWKKEVKNEVKEGALEVKDEAVKIGRKTASISSKAYSAVTDQVYKNKTGPDGQTIYIDSRSHYYWINEKGRREYIAAEDLKDKK